MAAAEKRRKLNIPIRFTRTTVSKGSSWWGPFLETIFSGQPTPAQPTAKRIEPNASTAASTAAFTSSSAVTSQWTAIAESPSSPESASAFSSFTSAMATLAPRWARALAVASPSPEAPPDTIAPVPFRSMAAAL